MGNNTSDSARKSASSSVIGGNNNRGNSLPNGSASTPAIPPSTLHLNLVINGNPLVKLNNSDISEPVVPGYNSLKREVDSNIESQAEDLPNEITVMTFSLRKDSVFDGSDQWKNRRETVANIILESNADIIAVQEGLQHQVLDLFTLLNEKQERSQYLWFGLGQSFNQNTNEYIGEYVTIFYNTEKIELLDQGCFWYSYTPATKGSRGWDAVAPRLCTWCKFRNVKSKKGNSFHVFNTHWDIGVEARRNSAYLIREYIENLTCERDEDNQIVQRPCIVLGNLNSLPDSNSVHLLSTGIDLGAKGMEESGSDEDTASDASNADSEEEDMFKLINADPHHHPTFIGFDDSGPPPNITPRTPRSRAESPQITGDSVIVNVDPSPLYPKVKGKCTDYIFVSPNVQVLDFRAITEIKCKNTGRNASDHLPIMAALLV